jgi:hypothetical protein
VECLVVGLGVGEGGGEVGVGAGELVDARGEVGFGEVVQAGAEGEPQLLLVLDLFDAQPLDLGAGQGGLVMAGLRR